MSDGVIINIGDRYNATLSYAVGLSARFSDTLACSLDYFSGVSPTT